MTEPAIERFLKIFGIQISHGKIASLYPCVLTLLELLCRGQLKFMFNQKALDLMIEFGLATKWQEHIGTMLQTNALSREDIDGLLKTLFPNPKKQGTNRRIVLEAAALAYYQQSKHFIRHLITDDAPQFNLLALHHGLCWIREGRHYKKLNPFVDMNRKILDNFLERFWNYYRKRLISHTLIRIDELRYSASGV